MVKSELEIVGIQKSF